MSESDSRWKESRVLSLAGMNDSRFLCYPLALAIIFYPPELFCPGATVHNPKDFSLPQISEEKLLPGPIPGNVEPYLYNVHEGPSAVLGVNSGFGQFCALLQGHQRRD
jgi:hypothetical protein